MNVEITHTNNVNDKHIVSVRQLKMAKLRPEQIGDLPIMKMEEKEEIMKQELKEKIKLYIINNEENKTPVQGPKKLGKITRTKEFLKRKCKNVQP